KVGGGGVGWLAGGFQVNFGPATPSMVEVEVGGFADDDKVGLHILYHRAQGDAFHDLFHDGGADDDFATYFVAINCSGGVDHGRQCPFHVCGAAAINATIVARGGVRFVLPFNTGRDTDCVDMGVEEQRRPRSAAVDGACEAAIFVNAHFVK